MPSVAGFLFYLLAFAWVCRVGCDCPNGCSSRGLCVNNACQCAEGLSGIDCSTNTPSSLPTLYECPSCYTLTVGPPQYYTGPSWRIPDGPIVAMNYKGLLNMYQGNGNGELVAQGLDKQDWTSAPIVTLSTVNAAMSGPFDSCGSWIMRAFTIQSGLVLGFYHAETKCNYTNNQQTRKSGGYAVSQDGGKTFTKPGYTSNMLVDTSTPFQPGMPTGEGDISVVLRGNYFYLFFANVEKYYTGVARAAKASDAYPGAFYKYNNGAWNSPAVGGQSSGLSNICGPQAYLHTPSQSFVAIGNANPYWNRGFMMSVSDDAVNWNYFADPVLTPDRSVNNDQFMYPSLMGPTGGYDIGSSFEFFYMWIPPGGSWSADRYQMYKDVKLTYVGYNQTAPKTKMALTSFVNSNTGETWQTTEFAFPPYYIDSIVGYLMTVAYPNTFPVYDCVKTSSNDHFIGTLSECVGVSGVKAIRAVGHMWSTSHPNSVAAYRCYATNDMFLSTDSNCEGRASPQTNPFGYFMSGPDLTPAQQGSVALIPKGSTWKYYIKNDLPNTWNQTNYDDSAWPSAPAAFGNMYSSSLYKTFFGNSNHYFRTTFTVPSGNVVKKLLISIASDNYADVYLNGVRVDHDPQTWHEATYWNRRINVDTSLLVPGKNQISVQVFNLDSWAFFDCEVSATYAGSTGSTRSAPVDCNPSCVNGQCSQGECKCDSGWSGPDCTISLEDSHSGGGQVTNSFILSLSFIFLCLYFLC